MSVIALQPIGTTCSETMRNIHMAHSKEMGNNLSNNERATTPWSKVIFAWKFSFRFFVCEISRVQLFFIHVSLLVVWNCYVKHHSHICNVIGRENRWHKHCVWFWVFSEWKQNAQFHILPAFLWMFIVQRILWSLNHIQNFIIDLFKINQINKEKPIKMIQ